MDLKNERANSQSADKDNVKSRQISSPITDNREKRDDPENELDRDLDREIDRDLDLGPEEGLEDDLNSMKEMDKDFGEVEELVEEDYDDLDDEDLDDFEELEDEDLEDLAGERAQNPDWDLDLDMDVERELKKPGGIDPARSEASRYNEEELLNEDRNVSEQDERNVHRDRKDDDHRVVN